MKIEQLLEYIDSINDQLKYYKDRGRGIAPLLIGREAIFKEGKFKDRKGIVTDVYVNGEILLLVQPISLKDKSLLWAHPQARILRKISSVELLPTIDRSYIK